jgi:hypothetical protein
VVEAINNGQIPPAFQEDLSGRANELVNEVNCPPPPTDTSEDKDKDKGKGKKKKDQQEQQPTDTVITEPIPTDTAVP